MMAGLIRVPMATATMAVVAIRELVANSDSNPPA